MGEARRRTQAGLVSNKQQNKKRRINDSPRIVDWLPITEKQRSQFFDLTIKGGWIGLGILILVWLVVRIIGPAAGWWVPADLH